MEYLFPFESYQIVEKRIAVTEIRYRNNDFDAKESRLEGTR